MIVVRGSGMVFGWLFRSVASVAVRTRRKRRASALRARGDRPESRTSVPRSPSRTSPAALRLKIYQNMDLQMAPLHCTNAQENRETWSGLPWPCWGARRFLPATASGRGPYSARDLGMEVERHAFDPIRGQQQSPRLPGRAAVTREATECGRSSRRASTTRPRPTSRGAQRRFPGL